MKKIFKIKRTVLDLSTTNSELAKSRAKGKTLAVLLMTSLASLGTTSISFATESTVGQGNLVTGEKGVAEGYNNTVTAVKGSAQGNDSISTGNNLTRDEFSIKLNEYSSLLSNKTIKEGELSSINTNLDVNKEAQDKLSKNIQDLDDIINSATHKSNQIDNLNHQLDQMNSDLISLQDALRNAKEQATNTSPLKVGDKTIWTDFAKQLKTLDWNKWTEQDGSISLANDLKNLVESDFPEFQGHFSPDDYKVIVDGYVNKQGSYNSSKTNLQNRYEIRVGVSLWKGAVFDVDMEDAIIKQNKSIGDSDFETITENLKKVFYRNQGKGLNNLNTMSSIFDKGEAIILLSELLKDTTTNLRKINDFYVDNNGGYNPSQLSLAPLTAGEKLDVSQIQRDIPEYSLFKDTATTVSFEDYEKRDLVSYYTKIIKLSERVDYSSDLWIINKDEWKAGFDKVLNFAKLIKEYMTTYDEINQNRSSNEDELKTLQQKLLSTRSKLVDLYNDPDSGINYNSISYSLNEKGIAEIRKGIELVKEFEHEVKTKLALYDPANAIVQGITKAAQDLQDAISNAQEAIDNKQSEIDEINRQISDLALTPDEQGAADLKRQKEQELANKKAEKEQLEQDKTSKQAELNEINRRLSETQLANLGKNSLAVGTNAFSSGNDSIAIGTNSTVTANDGIAIGQDSSVTGKESIAIGKDSKVSGTKSIAIGVGHTVSGNRSGTFGDPNVIHADDAYVIGNNNTLNANADNTFVLGSNVVTDVANSVALGNGTTLATAVATPSMAIRGSTHSFAGTTPVGVLSIGAENAERTITHVAAGRVTDQSTDAINGSQLYALADAVNNLQLDAINPDDVSDAIQNAISNNIRAGANVTIDEEVNPDNNQKTFTINAVQPTLKAGDNIEIVQDGNNYTFKAIQPELVGGQGVTLNKEGNRITIEAEGKTYTAGDNVSITPDNKINVNGTTISSGAGITVTTTTSTGANGATNTNYEVALSDTLKAQIAKEESVTAGSPNVIVKQEGTSNTGGKNFVVDIAKNLDLTETGSLKMGDINLAAGNVNMGGNVISGVAEGKVPTDAVNVSQLNAAKSSVKAGDKVKVTHEKQDDGSTVYTVNALTSHVTGGKNVVVDKTTGENGEDKFTVNLASDLTDINSIKKGDTGFTFGDNNIDVGGATLSNIGTPVNDNDAATKSYVDNSRTSVTSTDATVRVVKTVVNAMTGAVNYDLSVTAKAPEFTFGVGTKDEIKFKDGGHLNIVGGSDAIETKVDGNTIKVDLSEAGKATLAKVNNGINSQTDDGKTLNYQLGDTIKVTGDGKNLTTTTTAEGKVSVRLKDDVKVNSVTTGNVSISTQGINAGGNKVVNVANGHISPTSKDAVNGSQLYAANIQVNQNTQNIANLGERVNHLDNKINRVNKDLRAGVAGSAAIAGLPQVRGHGKSMIAASTGNYKGQSAIAIGYSRASDNGKVLFKLSGSANTQGDIVSSIGLGYEW